MRQPRYLRLLFLVASGLVALALAGCATTVAGKLGDANTVVRNFTERTATLCTGLKPVLTKADCLKRTDAAREAQKAVNAATDAVIKCTGEGVVLEKCATSEVAQIALQRALAELDKAVYRSQ